MTIDADSKKPLTDLILKGSAGGGVPVAVLVMAAHYVRPDALPVQEATAICLMLVLLAIWCASRIEDRKHEKEMALIAQGTTRLAQETARIESDTAISHDNHEGLMARIRLLEKVVSESAVGLGLLTHIKTQPSDDKRPM